MEYDELIEKIKDALKITKLELYEKADLQAILKEARKAKKTGKEISIIEVRLCF